VVDVGGNDGATTGDLGADELGGDEVRDLGAVGLARMLVVEAVAVNLFVRFDF